MAALLLTHAPEPAALRAEVAALTDRLGPALHRRHVELAAEADGDPDVRAWLVRDGRETVGAVLRRSDRGPLVVALDPGRSAFGLAAGLVAGGIAPGELIAEATLAQTLAQGWAVMVGGRAERLMGLHLLTCREVVAGAALPVAGAALPVAGAAVPVAGAAVPVGDAARPPAAGHVRAATPADAEVVRALFEAFVREALPHRADLAGEDAQRSVDRLHRDTGLHLLVVDDEPVAMTRIGDLVAGGRPILSVYTPPEHRGRGYATALVAALTRDALADDTTEVNLATDVDHPFSTALYERIGFHRVGEQASCRVDPAAG